MRKDILLKKIEYSCPVCESKHDIEVRERRTQALVKGEVVDYEETYYLCRITSDEENEFIPSKILNKNLLKARDSYRVSNGLLTSIEIKEIRAIYSLTQSELAFLLGWGEVTVTRYESKKIQDETYDNVMRMVRENPSFALESLIKHKGKFDEDRHKAISEYIKEKIVKDNNQYLKHQELKNLYLLYNETTELNGYKLLDLEKLSNVIKYFAEKTMYVYKVKLMKLLWYADSLYYSRFNSSMTGLVYEHRTYGALPIGFNEILEFPAINVQDELMDVTQHR